jgi:hypothetical protein
MEITNRFRPRALGGLKVTAESSAGKLRVDCVYKGMASTAAMWGGRATHKV